MPQAWPAFVKWLGTAGWKQFAVKVLINVGISAIVNKLTAPNMRDDKGSLRSLKVIVRGTTEHQRIIYGETLAGGVLQYINTAGPFNQYLYQSVVVAGHEIEDITDMWIDDFVIPAANIDWDNTGQVTSGDFRGDEEENTPTFFHKYLGAVGQEASANLQLAFTDIDSSHIGAGQAYFIARLNYVEQQSQVWSAGVPNAIRGIVRGKKIYDPRLDSTQTFGLGDQRLTNSLSWAWSDNPALCWADYMIDGSLGFGEDYAKIDYGYVASAAAICDGIVYTPVGTDKRFRCNGIMTTGETYETNIKKILSSMNGQAALLNGTWKVRAYSYETPTLQFTDDDLRDTARINLYPEENARYNMVRGTFVDKERLWRGNEFPAFTSSEYLSRDNDQELPRDIRLSMTTDTYMAQRLAAGLLEQSDNEISAVMPTKYTALPAEVGGTIMWTNTKLGWVNKVFRVERFDFKDMGGIDLLIREDSAAAYADVATNEYTVASQGFYTVNDPGIPAPTSLTAESRLEGIQLNCYPPAARLYEYIHFYAASTNSQAQAQSIARIRASDYLYPVHTGTAQHFWTKAENVYGGMSDFFPNSDQTNVIASVSSAVALVHSENTGVTTLSSDWASATLLASTFVNPGGDFNFLTDITVETMMFQKAAMSDTQVDMRVRYAVDTPDGWSTLGIVRESIVNSVSPQWHTLKRNLQSNINTNHYFGLEAIADYSIGSEWIANSYSNITAKLVPQERSPSDKIKFDNLMVWDNVEATVTQEAPTLNLDGHTLLAATNVGAAAKMELKLDQDGNVYYRENVGSWVQIDATADHTRPASSSPGSIEARFTNLAGDGTAQMTSTEVEDTWWPLSSGDFVIAVTDNTPTAFTPTITFDLEIRNGDSGPADDTGAYSLEADRDDG